MGSLSREQAVDFCKKLANFNRLLSDLSDLFRYKAQHFKWNINHFDDI